MKPEPEKNKQLNDWFFLILFLILSMGDDLFRIIFIDEKVRILRGFISEKNYLGS